MLKKTNVIILAIIILTVFIPAAGGVTFPKDRSDWRADDIIYLTDVQNKYITINPFYDDMAAVSIPGEESELWGFINILGVEVIPCIYDSVGYFKEGIVAVRTEKKWGFIDNEGVEIIPPYYDATNYYFYEGLAAVRLDGKWGFIDETGAEIIPFKYEATNNFSEGMAAVQLEGKWGFVDRVGNEVVPCQYSFVSGYYDGMALFLTYDSNNKAFFGYIDVKGNEVISPQFTSAGIFNNGIAIAERDGRRFFIDKTGAEVDSPYTTPVYKIADGFTDSGAYIFDDGTYYVVGGNDTQKFAVFDANGKMVSLRLFDEIIHSGESYIFRVRLGDKETGKYGFLRINGKELVPCQYDGAEIFSAGYALVRYGDKETGKYGYIDAQGNECIPVRYDYAHNFTNGISAIKYNGGSGVGEWGIILAVPSLDTANEWARESIRSAVKKGFVPFELQGIYKVAITRQEFCRLAVKYIEYASGKSIDTLLTEKGLVRDEDAFTDTANADILAAYALGITSGSGEGTFTPNGQFTRESAAQMIMNVRKVLGYDVSNPSPSGFADVDKISSWTKAGVDYCVSAGIMSGGSGNTFNPKGLFTREMSIMTFDNIEA